LRKYNTIIFVPHARAPFRKLSISTRLLGFAAAAAAGILLAAVAFGWAYFASERRDRQYRRALAENARLRESTQQMNQKLAGLTRQLDDFESRARQLAIVAGLPAVAGGGVGGPSVDGRTLLERSADIDRSLVAIAAQFARREQVISSTPTVAPVRGVFNSGFGTRRDPFNGNAAFHTGLDISTRHYEPVLATADGVVTRSGWSGDYGQMVEITHRTGYRTVYGHLASVLVRQGGQVRRGDRVGLAGSTGRSTGTHLHYEVRRGDRPVNPLEFILDGR
jgi:murein DD-endopeptidase MepM/ murein hydrolase activator NlpD